MKFRFSFVSLRFKYCIPFNKFLKKALLSIATRDGKNQFGFGLFGFGFR